MSRPFFTIITCTYNSERFIKKNILSVFSQTFTDYEHLFIDGQSSDKTMSIISAYQQKNSRVKSITAPAQGIAHAFNQGLEIATGRYILFLNSDDSFFDKDVLLDSYIFLKKHDFPDWSYGQINVVEENGHSLGFFPKRILFTLAWSYLLKFFNFVPHQAVFMKRAVFKQFSGFDEKLESKMDPELWLRVRNQTRWLFQPRVISNYMIRADARSSSLKNRSQGMASWELVQRHHMNQLEFWVAQKINTFIDGYNKVRR